MNRGFYICPVCGCHLDPGEKCDDCRREAEKEREEKESSQTHTDQKKQRRAA